MGSGWRQGLYDMLYAWEIHVLHVMSFWENICFSCVGISARDALAVEVVYHHNFFVFGQRSVYHETFSQGTFSV